MISPLLPYGHHGIYIIVITCQLYASDMSMDVSLCDPIMKLNYNEIPLNFKQL